MSKALDIARRAFEARFSCVGHIGRSLSSDAAVITFQMRDHLLIVPAGRSFAEAYPDVPFVIFSCGGVQTEGLAMPTDVETEAAAIEALFRHLNAYADECAARGATALVWRTMPETDFYKGHKAGRDPIGGGHRPAQAPFWKAYARLACVAAPEAKAA